MSSTALDLGTDTHVHTSLCNHAVGEMEDYVRAAIDKGLHTLIFLEHLEAGITNRARTWLDPRAFAMYMEEGHRLQEEYAGQLIIKLGVEAGYNRNEVEELQDSLARYNWDRVGLSYHFYPHQGEFFNLLSRNPKNLQKLAEIGVEKVLTDYFDALLEGVETIACDAICHMDAVLRHLPDLQFQESHCQQIERLLDSMKRKSIALELNTSGYSYRGFPFPAAWILALTVQKGIALSAGSDAHQPKDVGRYFDLLPVYLERSCRQYNKSDIK